jgi:hypothetical protein
MGMGYAGFMIGRFVPYIAAVIVVMVLAVFAADGPGRRQKRRPGFSAEK